MRPAVSDQRSSLAIEAALTCGLAAIPQPAATGMLQAHAARKAPQVPGTWRAIKKILELVTPNSAKLANEENLADLRIKNGRDKEKNQGEER